MRAWVVLIALVGCGRIGFDGSLDEERARGAISVGDRFACAIRGGAVWCWGDGRQGQLGEGKGLIESKPGRVDGVVGAIAVAAGGDHACAVTAAGEVWCWGNNGARQLGSDLPVETAQVTSNSFSPRLVPSLPGPAVAVAASSAATCARIVDGTVWCWGANDHGQLGRGTISWDDVPAEVPGLAGVIQVTAASDSACALLDTGDVWCWGENGRRLIDDSGEDRLVPTVVAGASGSALTLGGDHACVLSTGRIACWGANDYGALGDGTEDDRGPPVFLALDGITSISAAFHHTCVVRTTGAVVCWGINSQGQLGDGTFNGRQAPALNVVGLSDVAAVAAGGDETCALRSDETIACWGNDSYGQLGDGRSARPRPGLTTATGTKIAVGKHHTCTSGGARVTCWGHNSDGQLGATTATDYQLTPIAADQPWAGNVTSLTAGGYHTCVLIDDGTAWCWGYNGYGQLGDGTGSSRSQPAQVPGLGPIAELHAGYKHTCARLVDSSVWCWGRNDGGQVGDGTTTQADAPVMTLASGATALGVGENHACALVGSQVRCWGYGSIGQIGDGAASDALLPVAVGASSMAIAVGGDSTCSDTGAGLECWGYNGPNLLDGGTSWQEDLPVPSAQPSLYTLGPSTAYAAMGAWGSNSAGQLGIGTFESTETPTPMVDLPSLPTEVALGDYHACAIVAGQAYCWGDSPYGELGIGLMTRASSPIDVAF